MKLKKTILLILACAIGQVSIFAQYSGGNGSESDPYQIGTADDLIALSQNTSDWNGNYFALTADIDMDGKTFTPIGSTITSFKGTFDGKKHTISNLTITPTLVDGLAQKGTALFGAISGNVSNLGMINTNIDVSMYSNSSRVGAIAGELISGSITKCFSEGGTINSGSGGWTGGLVGCMFAGGNRTVEDCYTSASVTAGWRSGGVIGCTRGTHKINRVSFYGTLSKPELWAIVEPHNDGSSQKAGIAPTNSVYAEASGTDINGISLNEAASLVATNYPTFDFETTWKMDETKGYAVLSDEVFVPEVPFFEKIKSQRVTSDTTIEWHQFGPGMSGYNEEFWCHPTDTNVMFMGPDMHVSYGTWDNGHSWHYLRDHDGDGNDMERVNDIEFSRNNADFGIAVDRDGIVSVSNDRGRTWNAVYTIPHAAVSRWTNAHSRVAIDPKNDDIWYVGSGGFWDVKATHRTKANPAGIGNTTYAHGYILKTTDAGKTWNKIATSIDPQLNVGRIRINPNNSDSIVIATGQGMFMSTDAGATWNPSNTGLPNNRPKDLAAYYNPETKEYILYTAEQSVYEIEGNTIKTTGGVFKSTDGGATWESITGNLGLDFTVITDYTFRDKFAKAVAFYLGVDKSVVTALNYPSHTLQVFRRIVVDPTNKDIVYLYLNQRHDKNFGPGEVWKTEDGGQTWKVVTKFGSYWKNNTNASYWAAKGMSMSPNVEFSHVRYEMEDRHEALAGARNFAINANGQVFTGIAQQTHRSNNGGKTWQQIDDYETGEGTNAWVGRGGSNLPGRFILHETGIPDRKLLCSGEHGLWQTDELGDYPDKDAVAVRQIEGQVHDVNGNHGAHSVSTVAVHPNDPQTIFILAWRQEHRGWLRKTTDGGKTWSNVTQIFDAANASHESVASQYNLLIDPKTPDNMYFTAIRKPISCGTNSGPGVDLTMGEYGVHRSTDGGKTWEVINSGLPAGASVNRIVVHPDQPETLYACINQWTNNDSYGLFKSTNKGTSWSKVTIPSIIRSVNNLYIDKNTKYMYLSCGARTGTDESGGAYISKDGGATWTLFFEAPYVWHIETSPINPDKVLVNVARKPGDYAYTFKNPGFYLSQDAGETWTKINYGIGQQDKMVDIGLDPYNENVLWASAWGSGWFKAMLPYKGVKAVGMDSEVDEKKELTLYGMGSLGSQLEYKWIAPEGIEITSDDKYKITFTAPEVKADSVLTFKLAVFNGDDQDTTNVEVIVKNVTNVSKVEVNVERLDVFPNPVTGEVLFVDGILQPSKYQFFDLNGRLVNSGQMDSRQVDISALSKGVYLFKVESESFHKMVRLIRE